MGKFTSESKELLEAIGGKCKGIDKEEAEAEERAAAVAAHAPVDFKTFHSGETVAITEVPDTTFSEKVLGDGFTIHVKEGDRVKAGQKLITFDPEKIRAAGHPLTTMMVVTNDAGYENFSFENSKKVTADTVNIARAE